AHAEAAVKEVAFEKSPERTPEKCTNAITPGGFLVNLVVGVDAHTYERLDAPRGEFFHTNWTGHGGDTAASTYTA
ncbi:MAG: hypothetical protein IKN20_00765, partial [Firmicutes bacterium]|nr:hypothetical protein [Bacillota bacterium]